MFKVFYELSYDINIEINFWLETAKTCRLYLEEYINYLIVIVKTCNILHKWFDKQFCLSR